MMDKAVMEEIEVAKNGVADAESDLARLLKEIPVGEVPKRINTLVSQN